MRPADTRTREIDPSDRRRVLIHASPKGAERAFGLFDDLYRAMVELLDGYPEQELERFGELITKFRGILTSQARAIRDSQ